MSAAISADGLYRYDLQRVVSDAPGVLAFIMLNPSTADAEKDDPTIRRCIGFTRRFGYGTLRVVNLFPLRATDPGELLIHPAPEGHENCDYLRAARVDSALCIAAWGAHPAVKRLSENARFWLGSIPPAPELMALGLTNGGHPRHPLYLRRDAALVPFPAIVARSAEKGEGA